MTIWPADYQAPWTLAGVVTREGVGLHTGEICSLRLLPSSKVGFHVSWIDDQSNSTTLSTKQLRESALCTTLDFGSRKLATVEHLLAALGGCGLSHVEIQVSGEEVPILDGSALGWVQAIEEVGVTPAETPRRNQISLDAPLLFHRKTSVITATPSERFCLVGAIDFPQAAIGKQIFSIELTPEKFVKEIAPARTFGFLDNVEELRAAGLIQGASLENALVCDGKKWLNPPLRFSDEPVRHKLLDLIGDLSIVGFPKAQVIVYRGSHALHTDLATYLSNHYCDIS